MEQINKTKNIMTIGRNDLKMPVSIEWYLHNVYYYIKQTKFEDMKMIKYSKWLSKAYCRSY